jgi:hypothetical protein
MIFSVLVGIEAVNVTAAYHPAAQACGSQWIHGVSMKMHRVSANYRGENLFYPRKIPEWHWNLPSYIFTEDCGLFSRPLNGHLKKLASHKSYTYDKNNGNCNSTLPYAFILCKETTSPLHAAVRTSINFALSL